MIAMSQKSEPSIRRRVTTVGLLSAVGFAMNALLVGFIVLYANFPSGYNAPYGLSLNSISLFRAQWAYPIFTLEPGAFATLAALVMLSLWGVYLIAVRLVGPGQSESSRRQLALVILALGLVANVMLVLFMPPVLSSDIYSYGLYGRMVTSYQLNPYVATPMTVPDDPLVQFIHWRTASTRYGPVWTSISIPLAALGSQSVLHTVLAFKVVAAVFNLANGLFVFLLARRLTAGDGVLPLLLYSWNPLILIETAGSGHNDAVMLTFALLGVLLVVRGRLLVGLALLTLSVLVKYVTAFLLLFVAVRALAGARTRKQRVGLLLRMGVVCAFVVAVCYLPFVLASEGPQQFLTAAAPFVNAVRNPIHVLLQAVVTSQLASIGDRQWAATMAPIYLSWTLHAGLAVFLLLVSRGAIAQKPDMPQVLERWGVVCLAYLVLVYGGNLPWYLIPPMATTFVVPVVRTNRALMVFAGGLGILWMLPYAKLISMA